MVAGANFLLFLGSAVGISLTGVMMPGPVTAVTVAKGYHNKSAGALIALGHVMIELPLIAFIYFGLAHYLTATGVKTAIALAGGLMLIWMGFHMFRSAGTSYREHKDLPYSSMVAGLLTTVANPYFFLWWATVGAALLANAHAFGTGGVLLLAAVHWLCDFGWLFFLSLIVFKSKRLWTEKVHRMVFSICAAVLVGFGAWFIFSGLELALSA